MTPKTRQRYLLYMVAAIVLAGVFSLYARPDFLVTLANQESHPESVPVNALVPVEGTPLAKQAPVSSI